MRRALLAGLAILVMPSAAQAHAALGDAGGFTAGFLHPFGGMDHLLAMVAVGLWGAFLRRPLVVVLPIVFPTFMALGAVAGMATVPIPAIEVGIALSLVFLGLAVLLALKAPVWAACCLVGAFGLFHGYAHGQELPLSAEPAAYCTGFVLATGLLHAAGIGLGEARRLRWGAWALRGAGLVMSLAGGLFLRAALAS